MKINRYEIKAGAYLRGADLRGSDLRGADLRGSDLRGAYLRGANLRGSDLMGANLRGADLRGAYLSDADLRCANLDYAQINLQCSGTNFKIDEKLAKQIMLHALELSIDHFPGGITKEQVTWLMSGHRADEDCFQEFFEKVNKDA